MKLDLEVKNPLKKFDKVLTEEWEISDQQALECVPPSSWLEHYVRYRAEGTDAPIWYHIGAAITGVINLSGFKELRIESSIPGKFQRKPLQLWCMLTGPSGGRKSSAISPIIRMIEQLHPDTTLSTDGTSQEAIHDRVASDDCQGVALIAADELASLFAQANRAYSSGIMSWMLEIYKGSSSRETKKGGKVPIERARVSLLGCIPHETIQTHAQEALWASGWFPRMSIWAARQTRYIARPYEDQATEDVLVAALKLFTHEDDVGGQTIHIPADIADKISKWFLDKVNPMRASVPSHLFSCLVRLEEKCHMYLAALTIMQEYEHLIKQAGNYRKPKELYPDDMLLEYALKLVEAQLHTLVTLYPHIQPTDSRNIKERQLRAKVRNLNYEYSKCTEEMLSDALGWSRSKVREVLVPLLSGDEPLLYKKPVYNPRGRPTNSIQFAAELTDEQQEYAQHKREHGPVTVVDDELKARRARRSARADKRKAARKNPDASDS